MTDNSLNGSGRMIYDTAGNPVLEQTGYTYTRIYGPGTDELLGERLDLGSRYYTHDALGSVTSASDPDGLVRYRRTYRPFLPDERYVEDINRRMSQLRPGSLPPEGRMSMLGHVMAIGLDQWRLLNHVMEYWLRCKPPRYYGQEVSWQAVADAF